MDRGRRPAALALALAIAGGAAAADRPSLAEMRWLDRQADRVALLTTRPAECLAPASAGDPRVAVGRAAFRSPLVLGGQAARAGLSCESCHQEGRGNPHFSLIGVSGPPGTADVTSSLLSSHRGNGLHDPAPIPDLTVPAAPRKVPHDPESRALESFIHGLVVEEFDGPEPAPAVLDGLAAYVRALRPCAAGPRPLRAGDYLSDAEQAARAGRAALAAGDADTALVMIGAARARLGRVDERYPGLPRSRSALARADRDLAAIAALIRAEDRRADSRLAAWSKAARPLRKTLLRDESRSLFNPTRLRLPARGP